MEGEITHEPILEPKDHYSLRPLPLRIGTSDFLAEDDVGLVDYPSDSEGEWSYTWRQCYLLEWMNVTGFFM